MIIIYSNDETKHRHELQSLISFVTVGQFPKNIINKISKLSVINRVDEKDEICCVSKIYLPNTEDIKSIIEFTQISTSMDDSVIYVEHIDNGSTILLTLITNELDELKHVIENYYSECQDEVLSMSIAVKPKKIDEIYNKTVTNSLQSALFNTDTVISNGVFYIKYDKTVDEATFYTYLAIAVTKAMDSLVVNQIYVDFKVNYNLLLPKVHFLTNIKYTEEDIRKELFTDPTKFI